MGRFFHKLSTPTAAVVILICFLAVNGFLLYRQFATPTASVPPPPSSTPSVDTGVAPEGSSKLEGLTPSAPGRSAQEAPAASETHVLGDLRQSIGRCDGDPKCVRESVTAALPQATYIGGRIDLNADGSGQNKEILYFEDPNLGTCEHIREDYATDDRLTYTVILLGQGTFESERGSECIPET